jgi:hypothetical protein
MEKTHEIEYEKVEKKTKNGNSPLTPVKLQPTAGESDGQFFGREFPRWTIKKIREYGESRETVWDVC